MSQVLDLCRRLIQYKSIARNVYEVIDFVKKYLEDGGFEAEIIGCTDEQGHKSPALFATIGTGKRHFLFNGHLDVVDSGDERLWVFPPFEAVIDNNILYGRGVADMKGGIAAFIEAVINFINHNKFDGKISLLLASDEEEPIVETTAKALDVLYKRGERFDFALVGEPSNPSAIGEEIKIGRRGDVVLKIISNGISGHTAYPHLADNPVHHLIDLLTHLKNETFDNGNAFFEPSTLQITTIDVGNTATNVIPSKAVATVDIRFNSEHTSQKIISRIKKIITQISGNFELEYEVIGESFLTPYTPEVELLKKAIYEVCGKEPSLSTSGGTSDARFISQYCPVAEFGLTNASIHKINECEQVENIEKLSQIYSNFLKYFFIEI